MCAYKRGRRAGGGRVRRREGEEEGRGLRQAVMEKEAGREEKRTSERGARAEGENR